MNELKILRAALTREAFNKCELVHVGETLSPTGQELYAAISAFYERDSDAAFADLDLVGESLYAQHSKNEAAFRPLLERVRETEVSEENLTDVLLRQAERAKRFKVAELLANDKSKPEEIDAELAELNRLREGILEEDSTVGRLPLTDLFNENPRPFALLTPNMDVLCKGGAEAQTHLVLFARPESGKTACALTLCRRNAQEKGHRVMYVTNEDPDRAIQRRAICNWTNKTEEQLLSRPHEQVEEWLNNNGWQNMIFVSGDHQRMSSIEALVRKYQPNVLVVDQIRNMAGDSSMTVKLDEVGRGMRRLAKLYDMLCVSITQAGESGTDKLHLDAEDIEWSNTGLQGSADILLGVGMRLENRFTLGMNITKNKTGGGHGSWNVRLNHRTSRIVDEVSLGPRV